MNPKFNRKVGTEVTLVPQIQHQVLPEHVAKILQELNKDNERGNTNIVRDAYITALRHAGWTLQSVANALGISRERVRQIETKTPMTLVAEISQFSNEFPIPQIPMVAIEKDVYEYILPSEETLARLLELQPFAQLVRSNSQMYRKEAEEYTSLLWKAHSEEGVPVGRLAKCLGVTHGAVRFRLARYGYIEPKSGKSKVYQKVRSENRATS